MAGLLTAAGTVHCRLVPAAVGAKSAAFLPCSARQHPEQRTRCSTICAALDSSAGARFTDCTKTMSGQPEMRKSSTADALHCDSFQNDLPNWATPDDAAAAWSAGGRRARRRRALMDNRDADEADAADPDAAAPRANGATPELDVVEPVMTFSQQNSRQQPNQAASAEESQQAATAARAGNGAGPRSAEQTWDDWGTWNGSSVASSQPQGSGGGGARSASRATDGAGVNGAEAASAGDDDDFWQDEDGDPPDITTLTQDERVR